MLPYTAAGPYGVSHLDHYFLSKEESFTGLSNTNTASNITSIDNDTNPKKCSEHSSSISSSSPIFVRIYYPSSINRNEWLKFIQQHPKLLADWTPSKDYIKGYGDFIGFPWFVSYPLSRLFLGGIKMSTIEGIKLASPGDYLLNDSLLQPTHPAYRIVKQYTMKDRVLVGHSVTEKVPPSANTTEINSPRTVDISSKSDHINTNNNNNNMPSRNISVDINQNVEKESESFTIPDRFPVLIFSHGLGGMRTTYSALITEMASHGWVVFSLEHHDGSACASYKQDGSKVAPSAIPKEKDLWWSFRHQQLLHRAQELSKAIDLVIELNNGNEKVTIPSSTANGNDLPGNFQKCTDSQFQNRLDINHLVIGGHSFGAATCFQASLNESRFSAILALDPWMYPLKFPLNLTPFIMDPKPLLVINSESFHTEENKKQLDTFLKDYAQLFKEIDIRSDQKLIFDHLSQGPRALANSVSDSYKMASLTILGTGHQNQSDFPLIVPYWAMRLLSHSFLMDAQEALLLNTFCIRNFLSSHLPSLYDTRKFPPFSSSQFSIVREELKPKQIRVDFAL